MEGSEQESGCALSIVPFVTWVSYSYSSRSKTAKIVLLQKSQRNRIRLRSNSIASDSRQFISLIPPLEHSSPLRSQRSSSPLRHLTYDPLTALLEQRPMCPLELRSATFSYQSSVTCKWSTIMHRCRNDLSLQARHQRIGAKESIGWVRGCKSTSCHHIFHFCNVKLHGTQTREAMKRNGRVEEFCW